jgi:K+ transporter
VTYFIGPLLLVTGVLGMVLGIAFLLTGFGVLRGRSWARRIGIVLSIIGALLLLPSLLSSLQGDWTSLVLALLLAVLFVLTAWVLGTAGAYFTPDRRP